jgi:glutathione synthase/RimK-type ligase-like ATP-grasp enzyme
MKTPVLLLDQRDVMQTSVEVCVGSTVEGVLRVRGKTIKLDQFGAIYLRSYDSTRMPNVVHAGEGSDAWKHARSVDDILMAWIELTSALVVNLPGAMAANNSKPYQAAWIRRLGFEIPETLVTTDPDAVLEFWREHRELIYKSVSGTRSIVSRLTSLHRERIEKVTSCPTQFQQYISGVDYRVHVVGEDVFASRIISQADDYRYASRQGMGVEVQPCELPKEIADRCVSLAAAMTLPVAGVDLRCTADGRWYCFEVNPSPAFSYYQEKTGQPIAESIARLLLASSSTLSKPVMHFQSRAAM